MMKKASIDKPYYGNWVSLRFVYVPLVLGLIFLGAAIISPWFVVAAAFFLLLAAYFAYARYLFSPQGRNLQNRVRAQILSHLDWDGEGQILDIGCGSGALMIELARKYPKVRVIGIDNWGGQWGYSRTAGEQNAAIEGVTDQVVFRDANAAKLPFDDASMDVVVSNLTFHEVAGVKDKRELVREALRVLKENGRFVFQDLFMWKQIYGAPDELIATIQNWGIQEVKLIDTSKLDFIPAILKLPFMLGTIGVLAGRK